MLDALLTAKLLPLAPNLYPEVTPANAPMPAVVYTIYGVDPEDDLDGLPDHGWHKVMIDVYDPSKLACLELAKAIRTAIVEWKDNDVQCASFKDRRNWIDSSITPPHYRVSQDFLIYAALD